MGIRYSPSETKLLELLKPKPQDSIALCERYYRPRKPPYNGRKIIVGALTSLAEKARQNKESFRIRKSKRAGPNPMNFWVEGKR